MLEGGAQYIRAVWCGADPPLPSSRVAHFHNVTKCSHSCQTTALKRVLSLLHLLAQRCHAEAGRLVAVTRSLRMVVREGSVKGKRGQERDKTSVCVGVGVDRRRAAVFQDT